MAPCHAGQLLGLTCQTEATSKRVCNTCLAAFASGLAISGDRCRLLPQPCGTFSGRSFYSSWSCGTNTIDGVRPLKLVGGDDQLLVFVDAATALQAEQLLPGVLLPSAQESVMLRLCGGSKSFCPSSNFELSKCKTCRIHLAFVAGGKRQRSVSAPAANLERYVTMDDIVRLIENVEMPAPPQTSSQQLARFSSPPCDDSLDSECEACPTEPLSEKHTVQETGSSVAGDRNIVTAVRAEPASLEAQRVVTSQMQVSQRLFAHGETLKAGGSSQWTVVSDARLKDVVASFDLGAGELARLQPRVFRYKDGLAMGADPDKLYVGLLAQEVPEELAHFCRVSARVRLREEDTEETEIFMLDHSSLQFVTINAIREVEQEQRRSLHQVQQRLNGRERQQSETEERLIEVEGLAAAVTGSKQQPPLSTYGCRTSCWGLQLWCSISKTDGDVATRRGTVLTKPDSWPLCNSTDCPEAVDQAMVDRASKMCRRRGAGRVVMRVVLPLQIAAVGMVYAAMSRPTAPWAAASLIVPWVGVAVLTAMASPGVSKADLSSPASQRSMFYASAIPGPAALGMWIKMLMADPPCGSITIVPGFFMCLALMSVTLFGMIDPGRFWPSWRVATFTLGFMQLARVAAQTHAQLLAETLATLGFTGLLPAAAACQALDTFQPLEVSQATAIGFGCVSLLMGPVMTPGVRTTLAAWLSRQRRHAYLYLNGGVSMHPGKAETGPPSWGDPGLISCPCDSSACTRGEQEWKRFV